MIIKGSVVLALCQIHERHEQSCAKLHLSPIFDAFDECCKGLVETLVRELRL